jgi:predicted acyl esterase
MGSFRLAAILVVVPFLHTYAQTTSTDVTIQTSDSTLLDATITRPAGTPPGDGFPGIVLVHGYGGNKSDMNTFALILGLSGYASISYSVRGQGNSTGLSTTSGIRERQDLQEVITYFRNVRGINPDNLAVAGGSQGGGHSWMAAVYRMPGVRTVVPLIATPNFARDLVPNGCITVGLTDQMRLGSVRYAPERDIVKDLIVSDDYDNVLLYIDARNLSDKVDSVRIPVFQGVAWADLLFPVNAAIDARSRLVARGVPCWSYFGTNGHAEPFDAAEATFLLGKAVEWFDYWLKGSSASDNVTPLVFYADDRPGWPHHTTTVWPPLTSNTQRLFLTGSGLSPASPVSMNELTFSLQYDSSYTPAMAWEDGYEGPRFLQAFSSVPVRLLSSMITETSEITGIPRIHLAVTGNAPSFQAHVRICDVDSSGTWRLITRGNAGLRGYVPGSRRVTDIECRALSHVIPSGHRIGVEITSLDMWSPTTAFIIPFFHSSTATVRSSPSDPSYVDIPIVGNSSITVVRSESGRVPNEFQLLQNYPNPFNSSTTILFTLDRPMTVSLEVYDILGRRVAMLLHEDLPGGRYTVPFVAGDFATGQYFVRLMGDSHVAVRRMMLLR